jgi:hypothetical protein
MRPLAFIISAGLTLAACVQAQAGYRVVQGEGRAAIGGKDLASARKTALAEALHDAAGKLQSHVRGFSQVDTNGAIREESTTLVEGRFSRYRVLFEGREGGSFVVRIEALGVSEQEACAGKRVDLDMRSVQIRVAQGIQGHVQRNVTEGVSRGMAMLSDGVAFRVSDQRSLPAIGGAERSHYSQYDYMGQLTNKLPSPAGYSMSGQIIVETARRDGMVTNVTDVVVRLSFTVKDNYTGARVHEIRRELVVADRRGIMGLESLMGLTAARASQPQIDTTPLFEEVRQDLEEALACKPLRAVVLEEEEGGRVSLSVGLEHGVEKGDYFLVTLPNAPKEWQVIRIEDATPSRSIASAMKSKPGIPVNALATLMR